MSTRVSSRHALIILDMFSTYDFPHGSSIAKGTLRIAAPIAALAQRARRASVPVAYVNDMAGDWTSDRQRFLSQCAAATPKGKRIADLLAPAPADCFIFKPRHSAFYATSLPEWLDSTGATRLVLTGTTSHQCVLFTAVDAYVRDFELVVPKDTLTAESSVATRHALYILQHSLRAHIPQSANIRWR